MNKKINFNNNFEKTPQERNNNNIQDQEIKSSKDSSFDIQSTKLNSLNIDKENLLIRSIIDHSPVGIIIVDDNYRLLLVNRIICELLEASKEELIGNDFREFLPEESKKIVVKRYIRRHRGETPPSRYVFHIITKKGEIKIVDHSTDIISDSTGNKYSISHIIDITEKYTIEQLQKILHYLAKSKTHFMDAGFFKNIGLEKLLDIFLADKIEMVICKDNDRFFSVYNKSKETSEAMLVDESLMALKTHFNDLLTDGKVKIFKRDKEGVFIPVEKTKPEKEYIDSWLLLPIVSGSEKLGIIGLYARNRVIILEKTIRKILEEFSIEFAEFIIHKKIENERRRLAIAIESASEYIIITDPEGNIQYVNPAFEKTTGYTREEAIGKNPRFLKSGKQNNQFYKNLWDTIKSGRTWKGEFINRKKDGTLYYEEAVISPVFGRNGNIINFVAVKHDITEKKKLENQYMQAQKMEAIGRLAGGIAHDFNNMLSVIQGYSELIMNTLNKKSEIYRDLQEIHKAALRSSELTFQLLTFARKQNVNPRIIDLNTEIDNHLNILKRLIGENIKLEWRPGDKLWKVKLDPAQLFQILNNLCINARDAITDVGTITIETKNIFIDSSYVELHPFVKEGKYVLIVVTDDGSGMDENIKSHIFEPFFTTKHEGRGTGLGLASVYGAVKQNGGFILVYSEPGKGTSFKIYLPGYNGSNHEKVIRKNNLKKGNGEVVLLVEDEKQILNLTKKMLKEIGYSVLSSNNPEDALNQAMTYRGKIQVLVTDIIMPDMNGLDLAKRIKSLYPDIKVLFMSGYSTEVLKSKEPLDEPIQYLQKPFDIKTLSEKIHDLLHGNL